MKILIHCIHSKGGLTEHVNYQARALKRRGEEVWLLGPRDYLDGRPLDYPAVKIYGPLHSQKNKQSFWRRVLSLSCRTASFLLTQWRLAGEILMRRPDFVLLDSYIEYLSPLWVWPHIALAKFAGVAYVANLHDPVRDFQVGPLWWHKLSVRLAYAPIKIAIVHQLLSKNDAIPEHVKILEAPVGVYELQKVASDSAAIRRAWGVSEGQVAFLSFGFLRDNKNVDLLIRALPSNPLAVLVVVGSAQSSRNKPLRFYRELAEEVGVGQRVIFREEFVPDEALAGYFAAADVIAITYNGQFHSQSGVLNVAASAKRLVLASSGEGPLKTAVERFSLGEFVAPDSLEALAEGMSRLILRLDAASPSAKHPDWEGYQRYASWDTNVGIILEAAKASADSGV